MRIDRPVRKQKPISLTPLVDVIFLLLLFFMLSSTFTTFGQLEIGAPGGSGGTAELPKALLVLEGDWLQLNGQTILEEDLLLEAQSLRDTDIDSLLVLVRGSTSTQQLVTVMTQLKELDWLTTTVAEGR
ncbi:biopolymer transporter ExbD [Labrenzia sp. VG12]|nr:biopolymer transporter ExbD [Labrenzia sp. VG12]